MKLAKKHAPLSDLSSWVGSDFWAWRGSHALHCKACTGSVFDFLEGSRHFWRVCSGAGLDSNLGTDNRFGAKPFLIIKNVIWTFVFFSTLEVDGEEKSLVKIHTAMHILKIFRIIPNQIGLSLNPFSEAASKFEIGSWPRPCHAEFTRELIVASAR